MSITSRLSLFSLIALGVVLIGFSAATYALASWHLNAQMDEHLDASMHILVASIEVHPQNVEWEPLERGVVLGRDPDPTHVRWTMRDEHGHLRDHSANLNESEAHLFPNDGGDWRLIVKELRSGVFAPKSINIGDVEPSPGNPSPLPTDRTTLAHKFLLTVGTSETPLLTTLNQLALTLTTISLSIWVLAAILGRWICQQALRPVTRMAEKARALQHNPTSHQLLEVSAAKDELTDLGQSFNALLQTLRDSIEQQRRFAGDASHQLRTPLTALLTAVDVSIRHERSIDEYQRVLSVVQRRGRDLQQIVETLLMLTRSDLLDTCLHMERLELNSWCEDWITPWRDHVRASDIQLELAQGSCLVHSHKLLLGQILDNLLDNAIKYSEPGSPIVIRISDNREEVAVSVLDHGVGIAANDLSRIFQPFFRADVARYRGASGVGLGLSIAQRLAKHISGRLDVSSVVGSETTFSLTLPLSDTPAKSPQSESLVKTK